jgi:hypothetical protein
MFAGCLDVLLEMTVTDSVVRLAGIEGEFRLRRRDGWGLGDLGDLGAWLGPTFPQRARQRSRGTLAGGDSASLRFGGTAEAAVAT